jgi:hypothetical protein
LGLKTVSIEQAQIAVEKAPEDQRLQQNLRFVRGELEEPETEAA